MTDCPNCTKLREDRDYWKRESDDLMDKYAEATVLIRQMQDRLDGYAFREGVRQHMNRGLTKAVGRDTVPSVAVKGGEQC